MTLTAPGLGFDHATVVAVTARVLEGLDGLVVTLGRTYREEIPEYAALSEDEMSREVLVTSRRLVDEFFASVAAGGDLTVVETRSLQAAGRRRLGMGVPLDSALHAFRIAGRVVWTAVVEAMRPGEEHALASLAAYWIEYVDRASTAFAEGYLSASHDHLRRLDARRRAIVDALLEAADAGDVAAVAARYSLALAPAYAPVLVGGPDVTTRIDHLLAAAPRDSLAGYRGDRVLLLLPGASDGPDLRALAVGTALVTWGRARPPGPALADEVRTTEAALTAAERAGQREGIFGPDDLLLEQLLASSPRVAETLRRRVVATLAAGDRDGVFRSTLAAYLRSGSIPETARREVVHANTVAYRLKRVQELTGLDPRVPEQAAQLVLACALSGEAT